MRSPTCAPWHDAETDYRSAQRCYENVTDGVPTSFFGEIGTALWRAGEKDRALEMWKAAVEALIDGSQQYADAAGGVGPGMLLWYGSIRMNDANAQALARKHLKRLSRKKSISSWPGPLARLAELTSTEEVLAELGVALDADHLGEAFRTSATFDTRLLQYRFYSGVCCQEFGPHQHARLEYSEAVKLGGTVLPNEWFLAEGELLEKKSDDANAPQPV